MYIYQLTCRQQLFCAEYLVDFNATQAAIRAGYSEKTAASIGHENLQKTGIVERIRQLQELRNKRTQVTADRIIEELAKMGFAQQGVKDSDKLKALGVLAKIQGLFEKKAGQTPDLTNAGNERKSPPRSISEESMDVLRSLYGMDLD